MKKGLALVFLSLSLGVAGCTGLEALMIGGLVDHLGTAYAKPWIDRYATVQSGPPTPTAAAPAPAAVPVPAKP